MIFSFFSIQKLLSITLFLSNVLPSSHALLISKPGIQVVPQNEYTELQRLAQYAQISYCANQPSFVSYTCQICNASTPLEQRKRIASDDGKLQGYVGVDPASKTIFYAFQGAVNLDYWLYSSQIVRREFNLENKAPAGTVKPIRAKSSVHGEYIYDLIL
jgi:hypothetical protein